MNAAALLEAELNKHPDSVFEICMDVRKHAYRSIIRGKVQYINIADEDLVVISCDGFRVPNRSFLPASDIVCFTVLTEAQIN